MPYRETDKTQSRKAYVRRAILDAARGRIAAGGYQAAQMQAIAADAGIATGTVYRYFDSKAELFAEVFRTVVRHEVDAVAAAAHGAGSGSARLQAVVETFVHRALRAPRLAYALLAEPVDPLVESERLVFRHTYAEILRELVEEGIAAAEFAPQHAGITATALVGMLNETLVGPLSPAGSDTPGDGLAVAEAELIESIKNLCLRAITGRSHPS